MRNPPERYIQTLQENFAKAPQWFGTGVNTVMGPERLADAPNTTNQNGKYTAFQRWFHFKEAFSPAFVSAAIGSLGFRPRHILDPFGGSGTSAITSQLLSLDATTVEVNPFLADVIKAKVSTLTAEKLRSAEADFRAMLSSTPSDLSLLTQWPATFVESEEKERWIFPLGVARRLSQYLVSIQKIEDEQVQRFFRVVLGAILVDCSNVYVNGKGRRYRSSWKENQPTAQQLDEKFANQFQTSFEDVLRFEKRPRSNIRVINDDSRSALAQINEPVDLIVFSPPYPNSFDYTDIYNVELWVLGYIGNSADNRKLRTETLRSHVQIRRDYEMPIAHSSKLTQTLDELNAHRETLWDADIPAMVGAYFRDLERVLEHCKRLLTPVGKVMMVVGDSRYASVRIDVATILEEIAIEMGFGKVTSREVRQMRSSAQQGGHLQLAESIVELSL